MHPVSLLRLTYRVNAVATLACGVLLLALGHVLSPLFAVPAPALWALGVGFVAFAAWILGASRRASLSGTEALSIGVMDAGYAVASFAALAAWGHGMTLELKLAVAVVALPVALFSLVELAVGRRLVGSGRSVTSV